MDAQWRTGAPTARQAIRERTGIGAVEKVSRCTGLKPKDLVGIPWRVAFALQADGWYLRVDMIWAKPNPMPESVRDRPTKAHEYVFLLTRSARYFYDLEGSKEAVTGGSKSRGNGVNPKAGGNSGWNRSDGRHDTIAGRYPRIKQNASFSAAVNGLVTSRNLRTVWMIPTEPYPEAHFATFPTALAERCIRAASRPGDTVLDPFGGSGTVGLVARGLGRSAVLIEISAEYCDMIRRRCTLPWETPPVSPDGLQTSLFEGTNR